MKFSIVVPVYNSEKYITEWIASVLNQSYKNWELILVDDGSSDSSKAICIKYAQQYPDQIFVYESKNFGVSHARNIAIKKANGDYVVFLDSDDYLLNKNFFEYLNNVSQTQNIDCFIGEFNSFSENENIPPLKDKKISKDEINNMPQEEVLEYFYRLRLIFTVWRFVVKRQLIQDNNLQFTENIIHEDEEWCTRMLLCATTFNKIPFPHYMYRRRANSIMSTGDFVHFYNYLKVTELILNTAQKQEKKYKKIFAQRCAYKCAGLVYFGLKDISEFLPPIKEETVDLNNINVFLCSSGSGKTQLAKANNKYMDLDIIKTRCHYMFDNNITDEEIEILKSTEGLKRNPDYPNNYLNILKKYIDQGKKILLVPQKLEIDFLQENNIDFCLIFPHPSCQREYEERFLKRGNSREFSKEVSKRLAKLYYENIKIPCKAKIVLKNGQYLADVLN